MSTATAGSWVTAIDVATPATANGQGILDRSGDTVGADTLPLRTSTLRRLVEERENDAELLRVLIALLDSAQAKFPCLENRIVTMRLEYLLLLAQQRNERR